MLPLIVSIFIYANSFRSITKKITSRKKIFIFRQTLSIFLPIVSGISVEISPFLFSHYY